MNSTKRTTIALAMPRVVALLIIFARHIVQMMTNSTWFTSPGPNPALATVSTDVDSLEAAEATAKGRGKGSAAARDIKKRVVENDIRLLAAYVLWIANQSPQQTQAIVESAGLSLRQFTRFQKAALAALMSAAPGEAVVRAKAVPGGKRASYEWQYSSDGGKTWLGLGTTTVASTTVQGLTVGTTYLFRFRTTVKRITGDWSQTISLFVH